MIDLVVWALLLGSCVLPLRAALLSFAIACLFDASGSAFASSGSVGAANAVKGAVIPLVLLARTWRLRAPLPAPPKVATAAFVLLCGYVALASAWSPYPLSALKFIVYLVDFLLIAIPFARAFHAGIIRPRDAVGLIWLALALGVVQTYLLGNAYGTTEERFTVFAAPQSFAAFMAYAAILVYWSDVGPLTRTLTILAAAGGILLAGSRYVTLGFLVIVAGFVGLAVLRTKSVAARIGTIATIGVLVAAAPAAIAAGLDAGSSSPVQRVLQNFAPGATSDPRALGTLLWRFQIYNIALNDLSERDFGHLVFGRGTSSGGVINRQINLQTDDVDADPNRIMHNEFLRAIYEWGIVGLGLFVVTLAGLMVWAFRQARRFGIQSAATAALAALPVTVFGLLIENILSGSSMPNGLGLAMVLAMAATAGRSLQEEVAS